MLWFVWNYYHWFAWVTSVVGMGMLWWVWLQLLRLGKEKEARELDEGLTTIGKRRPLFEIVEDMIPPSMYPDNPPKKFVPSLLGAGGEQRKPLAVRKAVLEDDAPVTDLTGEPEASTAAPVPSLQRADTQPFTGKRLNVRRSIASAAHPGGALVEMVERRQHQLNGILPTNQGGAANVMDSVELLRKGAYCAKRQNALAVLVGNLLGNPKRFFKVQASDRSEWFLYFEDSSCRKHLGSYTFDEMVAAQYDANAGTVVISRKGKDAEEVKKAFVTSIPEAFFRALVLVVQHGFVRTPLQTIG
mmetsp:Transcript_23039/g.55912  ORF Transcript_23039/g.55912 Transcript_23039/m.55912 type:complete len:301 (+) Transcript_23039:77-979(+)